MRLAHLDDPAHRRPIDPRFCRPGETVSLADSHPLLITTTASLDALNALIAQGDHPGEGAAADEPVPAERRGRPAPDAWAEDGWRRVRLGDVVFRVGKPCGRCVVTTVDQVTAERGREPLRTLALHRRTEVGLIFGQKLIPESRGTLRVGDAFSVVE